MINTSTILFLTGLVILLVKVSIIGKDYTKTQALNMTIWMSIIILLLGGAWILREYQISKYEKYGYDYAYRTGQLVAGTVFTSYPENVPGLGWVL